MTVIHRLVLLAGFLAAPAWAYDSQFAIDPAVNLGDLARTGQVAARVTHDGVSYRSDASAVLHVDFARLQAASVDYDHYVTMGMPNLRESHVVERDPGDLLYTWSRMSLAGQTSDHYLEVRLHHGLTPSGAAGSEWQLVPKHAGWTYDDAPAFSRMEGSWYMEPRPDGSIYVRYFLAAVIDTAVPDFIVNLIAPGHFRDGVAEVIRVLGRQAARAR